MPEVEQTQTEKRIEETLSVFEKLLPVRFKTKEAKLSITMKPKGVSLLLFEQRTVDKKSVLSITVDSLTKKIEATYSQNSVQMFRAEFKKKLTLVKNNIPQDVTVPFLPEFKHCLTN